MNSIPTSKDGDRIHTFQAREDTSRIKEVCCFLKHSDTRKQWSEAQFKYREEGKAGESTRIDKQTRM